MHSTKKLIEIKHTSQCILFSLLLSIITASLIAQVSPKTIFFESFDIENLNHSDFQEVQEQRAYLLNEPLNINTASHTELKNSRLFTEGQLFALLQHKQINGALIDLYELQVIKSFDPATIQRILPYIELKGSINDYQMSFKALITKGSSELFFRYQQSFPKKKGYLTKHYIGKPNQLYFRYKYQFGNRMYYGLSGEKDAGEKMFGANSQAGFDFYSGYFFWKTNTFIQSIALGDYHVNLGQGLILYTGFGFNKTPEVSTIKKEGRVIKPYSSINEYRFMRGAALTSTFGPFSLSPFVSIKKIDASIQYADSTNQAVIHTRIQQSGYHRSQAEIAGKNRLLEIQSGFNAQYRVSKAHIGLNFLNTWYGLPIQFLTVPYNQFQFQGKQISHVSFDYHNITTRSHFFGETAISINSNQMGIALINGSILNPSKIMSLSIAHRYYSPFYQTSNLTNAFGESTSPINEQGVYMGFSIKPSRKFSFSSYVDYFNFPWLKYQAKQASQGYDVLIHSSYNPSKTFEIYASYKREEKEQNTSIQLNRNNTIQLSESNRAYFEAVFPSFQAASDEENGILRPSQYMSKQQIESAQFVTPILTQRFRLHLSFIPNKKWTIQNRLEYSFINDKINLPGSGILLYQDVKFKSPGSPLGFSTRLTIFDISQFSNRIYAYENGVLNQFSIPSFFNAGMRYYLNLHLKINKYLDCWLKFAHTYYKYLEQTGTGNEQINSNKLYQLNMQLRLRF